MILKSPQDIQNFLSGDNNLALKAQQVNEQSEIVSPAINANKDSTQESIRDHILSKQESPDNPLFIENPLDANQGYEASLSNPNLLYDKPQTLDFLQNAAEVLALFDENIRDGKTTLYSWQLEVNEKIGHSCETATTKKPFKYCLLASNGSGKDAYVIAANAIFFMLRFKMARVIITSSSGQQLTSQTETYIKNLANKVNAYFGGKPIFKVNQRYIYCRLSGSEIRMFATDEAGKAEGYHPWPDSPSGILVMIINEAKNVPEEIIKATRRCTYTHWIYVSSAGEPKGSFHWAFTNYAEEQKKRVTSYDCLHKDQQEIEDDKKEFGEHSAWFRSKHLSLFTSMDSSVVLTDDALLKCDKTCIAHLQTQWAKRYGLDLAAGGDECVLTEVHGNKRTRCFWFRERDTMKSAQLIHDKLNEWGVPKNSEFIFADDGGIGHAIIDNLVRKGWQIKRILNQWSARNTKEFGNIGAENWFKVARIIQEGYFHTASLDSTTRTQLTSRHYRKGDKDKTYLKKKSEEKAEGNPSPDRADSLVLALYGLRLDDFLHISPQTAPHKLPDKVDIATLVEKNQTKKWQHLEHSSSSKASNSYLLAKNNQSWYESQFAEPSNKPSNKKRINNSLAAALAARIQ